MPPTTSAPGRVRLAAALRECIEQRVLPRSLGGDLQAGLTVGVIALPLSMALAIASGVPPQHGLYTAIVAGALIALFGGSRVQVCGPTAAFVVILAPIAAQHGLGGLLVATAMAGVILIALGLSRLGRLVEFIPYPVTSGFTAGIAVVIGALQIADLLGLSLPRRPEGFVELVRVLSSAIAGWRGSDVLIGLAALAILLLWPRLRTRVPAPLVALGTTAVAAWWLERNVAGFDVATIRDRFHYLVDGVPHDGIPPLAPRPGLPWNFQGANGATMHLDWPTLKSLVPAAFAIAMLGAIESLLSAVVADGMGGTQHDPDAELVAQGIGNVVAPFFGGIAATGAIARTATNLRAGARSPIAAIVHAVFVLVAMLALAPALGRLPMAAMAALLLTVAWNMAELPHALRTLRRSPGHDVFVWIVCFALTVAFDMVVAVGVGVVLAAMLFLHRLAALSEIKLLSEQHPARPEGLPAGVMYYEIAGPMFFGAAQRAFATLARIHAPAKVLILDLRAVPVIDATGLVNLESALGRLSQRGTVSILTGLRPEPAATIERSGLSLRVEGVWMVSDIDSAAAQARALLTEAEPTARA